MAEFDHQIVERYLVTLRIIQPARIQDIIAAYIDVWKVKPSPELETVLRGIHQMLISTHRLVSVRRGTYLLNSNGIEVTAGFLKERLIDNARLFLMKEQRRKYHKHARRFGLVAAPVDQANKHS